MSFQQLDSPWVKAEDVPATREFALFLNRQILLSTPIERRWFMLNRIIGRLDDEAISGMLVSLEEERPGCTSPRSESIDGSFNLADETMRERLAAIPFKEI